MSTPADSIFSDPSVQFLQKLLEDFRRGEITLPRFQRPFVWDKARRLALFDSVRRGIPIGSLMIWETRASGRDRQPVAVPKTELGPFDLPKVTEAVPRRFLLDGEQRLMTLYFALHAAEQRTNFTGDESPEAFEVFFDLEKEDFVTRDDLPEGPQPHHFPLRSIFVSRGVLRFQRELEQALEKGLNAEPSEEQRTAIDRKITSFIERTDTIAEAVRQYKIPVTVMATDDLALATETFKRVNSQGASMSEAHMMNAIAWDTSFDLLDRFAVLREGIEEHPFWQSRENFGDDVLLRIGKRLLGHDVYDEKVSEIAPKLRDSSLLQRVGDSMVRTAKFLATRGLGNPGHIRNVMQLVVLGVVFDAVPTPSDEAQNAVDDWLWFTSYTEVFSGVVRGSVYKHLERQALALAQGQKPKAPPRKLLRKPLPRFDFRGARSRALSWLLARRMMTCDQGEAAGWLAIGGSGAMLRVASPPPSRTDIGSSSAIRVLWDPEQINDLRAKIRDGSADTGLLEAQVFTPPALAALRARPRDVPQFVEIRERDLNELEETRFKEISDRLFRDAPPPDEDDD